MHTIDMAFCFSNTMTIVHLAITFNDVTKINTGYPNSYSLSVDIPKIDYNDSLV